MAAFKVTGMQEASVREWEAEGRMRGERYEEGRELEGDSKKKEKEIR